MKKGQNHKREKWVDWTFYKEFEPYLFNITVYKKNVLLAKLTVLTNVDATSEMISAHYGVL